MKSITSAAVVNLELARVKNSLNLLRDKENPNTASSEMKQMRQRGYERP